MFTFGIFTTHIPYIAMLVFYAYFLLFGVNQASEGKIQIAEKSFTVNVHIDNSVKQAPADTYRFYSALTETDIFEKAKIEQKWKHFTVDNNLSQKLLENTLFSRPPPLFI